MKDGLKKFYKELKNDLYHIRKNINYIHDLSGKLYIVIVFDMLFSMFRYGISDNEYRIFEFYRIKKDKRRTYLSISKHKRISWYLENDRDEVLNNKITFNKEFEEFLNRKVYEISKMSFKEFEEYALDNKRLIARNSKENFVKSYKVYNLSDYRSPAFMLDDIKKNKHDIVEKNTFTNKVLNKINSDLVIINVTTLNLEVIACSLKFKANNKMISGCIDIKKGTIKGHFKDEDGNNYSNEFENLEIPKFDDILNTARTLADKLYEVKEVEWSFSVNNKGNICLLDANKWEDFVFAQTPEFLNSRVGLLPKYKKHLPIWRRI